MTNILDTSIVIELERRNKKIIEELEKIKKEHYGPAGITFITYFEVIIGALKRSPKNKEETINFLKEFAYLNTTRRTAEILAELKAKYDKRGISLSLTDLLIAAQVYEGNHLLITKDNHFSQIDEIRKIILN